MLFKQAFTHAAVLAGTARTLMSGYFPPSTAVKYTLETTARAA